MLICTFIIFSALPDKTLSDNYQARMKTEEQLTAKANVGIYLNEYDVDGEYYSDSHACNEGNQNDVL